MNRTTRSTILFLIIALTLTGCGLKIRSEIESVRPGNIVNFYSELDKVVKKENIENAWGSKITGFPYLRSTRFFSYLKKDLKTREELVTWAEYLRQTDLEARKYEILNLSETSFNSLKKRFNISGDKNDLIKQLDLYSNELFKKDLENPQLFKVLKEEAETPSDYSTTLRVVGLYPLFYGPVSYVTHKSYNVMRKMTSTPPAEIKVRGKLINYSPNVDFSFDENTVKDIFRRSKKDSLGLPVISPDDTMTLVKSFAPSYKQDVKDPWDKIGEVIWKDSILSVNPEKPVVYYYISHTIYKNKPVVQLNYVNWYSRRDGDHVKWFEKGVLDGINIRVTLDHKGTPFMVDVVHQCGCFHFFVPEKKVVKKIKNQSLEFNALVLSYLPEMFPENRLSLRIASGGHLVDHIGLEKNSPDIKYNLVPYNTLLSIPYKNKRASMFNSDGIGKGTERREPVFLFMMGIPDVGAMRQRGHHPTKLIGKAHFDDPMFFNKAFEFK